MKGEGDKCGCFMCSAKLAFLSLIFLVLNLWDGLRNWVASTNVWWFVVAFIVFWIIAANCKDNCHCKVEKKKPVARKKAKKKKKK